MTESTAQAVLSSKLCPWLKEPLERCSAAIAEERLGHAWLIHGVTGIGKLNLAFVLARRLLSATDVTPPPISPSEFAGAMNARYELQNHHPDLHYLFPEDEKSTIGIEQVRSVIDRLSLKSFSGAAKVVIIEPAEAMTTSAANALLKTLEQPTAESYLFLISHCPGRLPATIRSRCQRLALRKPARQEVLGWIHGAPERIAEGEQAMSELASPLELAQALDSEQPSANETYARELIDISRGKADPIAVADAWSKRDIGHALDWLTQSLRLAIRARLIARGSNPITETTAGGLHTELQEGLSLRSSFEQLDKTETLRNQLGGGINAQLALRVLLLGFRPEREVK
jgi:DNA polymerase-3 subunit delta'